tara:strand:- start:212 stop:820 length:609 start_codon:yes stop_codon:yes gene_type:complete
LFDLVLRRLTNQDQYTFPDAGLYALRSSVLGAMMVARRRTLFTRNLSMALAPFTIPPNPSTKTSVQVWMRIVGTLLLGWLTGCAQISTEAVSGTHIRFYSINSVGQLSELSLVPGREEPGCHDMPLDLEVHRVAQIGFAACKVFAKNECPNDAALVMQWSGKQSRSDPNKNQPTTHITPGSLWFFKAGREMEVASWRCDLEG